MIPTVSSNCPTESTVPASPARPLVVFRVFVLAYCVWQASDLWGTWRASPVESWGGLMFCLWLVPALLNAVRGTGCDRPQKGMLAAAVLLTLLGQMTWLNCLQHLALALAIAGWRQPFAGQLVWLAASFLWMPASGWFLAGLAPGWETALRVVGVAAVSVGTVVVPRRWKRVAAAGLTLGLATADMPAFADTFIYSPVQSTARPLGLDVVDGVGLAGSDAASTDFLNNYLPTMQALVGQDLSGIAVGSSAPQASGFVALDPSTLRLATSVGVRAYFVGEMTGYHDSLSFYSLGFNVGSGGVEEGDPLLIFPDASINPSYGHSGNAERTKTAPLFPGDFVEMGTAAAGTELDFFLIANGANNGTNIFSTDPNLSVDGTNRAVAFAQANNPYILIGFEDLIGEGPRDYSDVLFAVYVGEQNVAAMMYSPMPSPGVPAPEPGFIWLLVAGCGGWLYRVRRKRSGARSWQPALIRRPSIRFTGHRRPGSKSIWTAAVQDSFGRQAGTGVSTERR